MEGKVCVDRQKCDKPGTRSPRMPLLRFRGATLAYVSRGGLKLEKALQSFPIDLNGRTAKVDIGASTGGFTDCMLKKWSGRVYAVDVGYGQLA